MLDPQFSQDEQFWTQWIDAESRRPGAWLDTAEMLKRAADELAPKYQAEMQAAFLYGQYGEPEPRPGLGPVYMMLVGFAIENLAKGLIVSHNPTAPPPNKHLDEQLVADAGIGLVNGEPELVRRLGVFLASFGRYPVPRPSSAPKLVHTSIMTAPMRYSTNEPNLIDPLYNRMRDALEQDAAQAAE